MFDGAVGWIDFDETEREKVDAVIDSFRDRGTIDELGFGRIRDSFADLLAPGVSTIQTRARYYLFVPWIFRRLEEAETPARTFDRQLRAAEVDLIDALDRGPDDDGIIGIRSREDLTRFPSSIYWNGLRDWGILRFDGSRKLYLRHVDELYRHRDSVAYADGGQPVSQLPDDPWHPGLPDPPDDFLDQTSFDLRTNEAQYLVERLQSSLKLQDSLLSELSAPGRLQDLSDVDYPWEAPLGPDAPESLRETLFHARNFAILTQGANLVYNLFLAEEKDARQLEDDLESKVDGWLNARVQPLDTVFREWDWHELERVLSRAAGHSIDFQSTVYGFLDSWREAVTTADQASDLRTGAVRKLVQQREHLVKGPRARLVNKKARENWDGESGTALQTYRWPQVQSFVTDIANALE